MDNHDRGNFDATDAYAPPSSPFPETDRHFSEDRSTAKAPRIKPRGLLRRLAGRWWQLLLLWLTVSFPIVFVISRFVQPTYEASALLHIEPQAPELFSFNRGGESQGWTYLKTEVTVITSDKVLEPVVANALVVDLRTIKRSESPVKDLREKLKVGIIDNTNLIRVALELPNRDDAITIIEAVIDSYKTKYTEKNRAENRILTESMKQHLKKLADQIEVKRSKLKNLYQEGKVSALETQDMLSAKTQPDATQPLLNRISEEQYAKFLDRLAQCDFDCVEALSHLEAAKSVRARNQNKIDEELAALTAREFKKDPRVVAMSNESSKLADSKDQSPPPAVLAAREKREKLLKEYEALWESEFPVIHKRLAENDSGMLSDDKIRELEVAVETATRKRTAYAKQLEMIKVVEKPASGETFEATYLNYQLNGLLSREDQVKKHLEQLMFEAGSEHYRVTLLDAASAPKNPTNDRRLNYMAAAPIYVFFLLLGLFLVQEIMAGRSLQMKEVRTSD